MFPAPGSRWLRAGAGCLLRSSRSSMHVGPAPELNTSSLPDSISPPKTQPDCAWWWPRVCCGPTAIHQDVAEKRKNSVQPSLNSGRKAPATRRLLCLRPAGRGRHPVSRAKATHRPPPWDSAPWKGRTCSHVPSELERRGSRRTKPCSSAFGSFFLNTGLSFSTELLKMPTRFSDRPTSFSRDRVSVWG